MRKQKKYKPTKQKAASKAPHGEILLFRLEREITILPEKQEQKDVLGPDLCCKKY
jgi:hypothetical protein